MDGDVLDLLFGEERYEEARKVLDGRVANAPDNPKIRAQRGLARYHLGDFAGAIEDFEEALTRKPGATSTRYMLAKAQSKLGNVEGALEHLAVVIEQEGARRADGLVERAECLIHIERQEEAVRDLERAAAIARQLGDNAAFERIVAIYLRLHDYESAIRHATSAVEVCGETYDILYNRALAWDKLGDVEKAIEGYTEATNVWQPERDLDAWYNRALRLNDAGRQEAAIQDLRYVVERSADPLLRARAIEELHAMELRAGPRAL